MTHGAGAGDFAVASGTFTVSTVPWTIRGVLVTVPFESRVVIQETVRSLLIVTVINQRPRWRRCPLVLRVRCGAQLQWLALVASTFWILFTWWRQRSDRTARVSGGSARLPLRSYVYSRMYGCNANRPVVRVLSVGANGEPDDCPFCAIVAGRARAREVWRTDAVLAFLPDVPAVLGHTLVVPTAHLPDIWSVRRAQAHDLADATSRVAAAVAQATNAEGMNIIQSNGVAAGQSVFHLHIHVVPRRDGDRMPELWPEDAKWQPTQLDSVAAELRAAIDHR